MRSFVTEPCVRDGGVPPVITPKELRPLAGWREVSVRKTKTKVDWATEMARLLEGRYSHCSKVILVSDNLIPRTGEDGTFVAAAH